MSCARGMLSSKGGVTGLVTLASEVSLFSVPGCDGGTDCCAGPFPLPGPSGWDRSISLCLVRRPWAFGFAVVVWGVILPELAGFFGLPLSLYAAAFPEVVPPWCSSTLALTLSYGIGLSSAVSAGGSVVSAREGSSVAVEGTPGEMTWEEVCLVGWGIREGFVRSTCRVESLWTLLEMLWTASGVDTVVKTAL